MRMPRKRTQLKLPAPVNTTSKSTAALATNIPAAVGEPVAKTTNGEDVNLAEVNSGTAMVSYNSRDISSENDVAMEVDIRSISSSPHNAPGGPTNHLQSSNSSEVPRSFKVAEQSCSACPATLSTLRDETLMYKKLVCRLSLEVARLRQYGAAMGMALAAIDVDGCQNVVTVIVKNCPEAPERMSSRIPDYMMKEVITVYYVARTAASLGNVKRSPEKDNNKEAVYLVKVKCKNLSAANLVCSLLKYMYNNMPNCEITVADKIGELKLNRIAMCGHCSEEEVFRYM
ncbi:hypothetical protein V1517DRAFT_313644 [Lipomyces orientalis]|uniref:Uncharacterized protein n=1 Tax=Lipomyces orientalis TaxID=1233043 RepID=A0ACC3TXA6_9ASCO